MVTETVRSMWAEPPAPDPPPPTARDWVLVAVASGAAVVETVARPDLAWRWLSLAVVVAFAFTLPWRRTHPLPMVLIAFGTVSVIDVVALASDTEWDGLGSGLFVLLLVYALARWGSGKEIGAGLAMLAVPLSLIAVRGEPVADLVGGAVILTLAAALGEWVRYQNMSREQAITNIRSGEREQLARELHDTVAHHVSAIAVQAQAGRTLAASQPDAAADALAVIEEEASRTLEEMRAMVGALRQGDQADLAPQQGVADIERFARSAGHEPGVEVELTGDLTELRPSVDAAGYRLAQEAITNALRHARQATLVRVRVCADDDAVRLTVDDDGHGGSADGAVSGFGLIGMAERAKLLGGTFEAGPRPDGGWTVTAVLPRHVETS